MGGKREGREGREEREGGEGGKREWGMRMKGI